MADDSVCRFRNCWFYFTVILGALLHIFDVGSDIGLSHQYFSEGNSGWGGITLFFASVSWTFPPVASIFNCILGNTNAKMDTKKTCNLANLSILLFCFVFNLIPVRSAIRLVLAKWRGDKEKVKSMEAKEKLAKGVIALFENFPQLCIQLYIIGFTNRITPLALLSILTSLISLTLGIKSYFQAFGKEITQTTSSLIVIVVSISLHLIAGLTPISFLASLKNHSNRDYAALHIFVFIYLIIIGACRSADAGSNSYKTKKFSHS